MIGQWDPTFPPLLSSQPANLVVEEKKHLFLANPSPLSDISTLESSPRTLGAGRSPAPAADLVLEYPGWTGPLDLWVSSLCGSLDQANPWLGYDCLTNECKISLLLELGHSFPELLKPWHRTDFTEEKTGPWSLVIGASSLWLSS